MSAMGIHGDKSQAQRSNIIKAFKGGRCNLMIATDVAARGLDIANVEYVINYDFPNDIENYVHRIGRTGRSNKTGTAITFFDDDDASSAPKLIKILKEAQQEVPDELLNLSKYANRGGKSQSRRYGGGYQRNNSFSSYNKRNQYNTYQRRSNSNREYSGDYERSNRYRDDEYDRSYRFDDRYNKRSNRSRPREDDYD